MGSFDPIHLGHLNMVRLALNSNIVDKVYIVPSGHNPWKKAEPAPFNLRAQMIEASIKPFKGFCEVSRVEDLFGPPYYSNKPLNHFKKVFKDDELYIICGADTTYKIPHWKNAEEDILPYYGIVEISRSGGKSRDEIMAEFPQIKSLDTIESNGMEISSTEVRELLKEGKNVYPLLSNEVIEIIESNKLYT